MWHMIAIYKRRFLSIPLKPILPRKPRDYSNTSLMSKVLHEHSLRFSFTKPSTPWANHWWCLLGCSAVSPYSANTLATSVLIAQSSHTCTTNGFTQIENPNRSKYVSLKKQSSYLGSLSVICNSIMIAKDIWWKANAKHQLSEQSG